MYSYLLTGVIAGIASSVLYISGTLGTPLSLLLYFLAPLPLLITGLGWGAISATVGAIAGVIVATAIAGISGGLIYFASIGLIPIVLSYCALMSRLDDTDDQTSPNAPQSRDWYPLGHLLLWIAGFATALSVVFIVFVMPSTPEMRASLEVLFKAVLDQNLELKTRLGGENAATQMVQIFVALLPVTLAGYTFTTTTANLWLASKIITASGRAIRPAFELSKIEYPRLLPLVLVGTLALTFIPGIVHVIALAGTASLTLAFMFLGLLVVHAIVPKSPARPVFLGAFYVTVFILLKYAYLVLALVGIAETIFGIRVRFTSSPPPMPPATRDP
jgi:hypothetical protein